MRGARGSCAVRLMLKLYVLIFLHGHLTANLLVRHRSYREPIEWAITIRSLKIEAIEWNQLGYPESLTTLVHVVDLMTLWNPHDKQLRFSRSWKRQRYCLLETDALISEMYNRRFVFFRLGNSIWLSFGWTKTIFWSTETYGPEAVPIFCLALFDLVPHELLKYLQRLALLHGMVLHESEVDSSATGSDISSSDSQKRTNRFKKEKMKRA